MPIQGQWLGTWSGDWGGALSGTETQAAPRSLLAFWAGGAVVGITPTVGVRSLLAFWAGGAVTGVSPVAPPSPPPSQVGPARIFVLPVDSNLEDDDVILLLASLPIVFIPTNGGGSLQ